MSASEPLHRQLGLTDDELETIRSTLGREPNRDELAMYAVMWSEHCSYKSSKVHLRNLPTEGPSVLVGPGQDAGAVDVGDGLAVVFKIESHSHPTAVEPYQGAATGVGGIVRDIISMGARPIALLDPLRFGPLADERNRWLFEGVVAGIGGYGNCIGVPTVGGEVQFAAAHTANPTVNVMCVGVAPAERLVTADREVHEGSLLVLFGAATGRDGIGGVSVLASSTLEEGAEERRPSVQIGDPFAEKLLIEASLELVERDLLEGLQDLGGAGITCAVSESASRAGLGAELDLDAVPLREPDLEAFEILTSESQERMLAIAHPERLDEVRAVCERWGLATAVIGRLVPGGGLRVRFGADTVADVPARSLADDGPVYTRPMAPPAEVDDAIADDPTFATVTTPPDEAFLAVLGSPNVASKRWVWEQYDSIVQGGTVLPPGADAALVRIEGTLKALALSTDGKGRFGALDPVPRRGARRRRGRAQRRLHRGDAARDHQLPQLRQPRAPRGDVAVRRVGPRDRRRLPRVRHAGDRRERQLLQRVGLLGDLADAGDRDARADRGLPPRGPRAGSRATGRGSTCWARRSPSSEGASSPRSCSGRSRGAPRRSISNASGGSTAS